MSEAKEIEPYFYDNGVPLFVVPWPEGAGMDRQAEEPDTDPKPFYCDNMAVTFLVDVPKKKPIEKEVWRLKGDVRGSAPKGTRAYKRHCDNQWRSIETGKRLQ